ncbi:MAG: IS21 family transposase [Candidatus Omnitrophica bacterium]|nr:IS21 family transposase [Candidatus Omnitrophota bacterium]
MSNVLDDEKQQELLALGRLGWTLRRIEQRTGIRRETASAYLKAAGIAVRSRGRPGEGPPKAAIAAEVSTDPALPNPATTSRVSTDSAAVPATRAPSASACEPYREVIAEALGRGRNAVAIWQDLVDDHGFTARYASVRRFVLKLRGTTPAEARVVITTAPGEEGQVDYGDGPMVRDASIGKYRRVRLFVLTLGYSRKAVRLLTWRSSTQIWAELHERAFRRLGGTVKVIVLDNLAEGVLTPDIYDPTLNPLYRDVLAHYGVVALPCRVGDPDRKGKVEAGIGHTQQTPLKGLRFETLEAAQAYLDRWEEHWADTRIHGTTKRQVAAMFAEERPALGPLPLEPFRYYRFGDRTVHLDGCVEVEAAFYGAPPGWIGQRVQVQWNDLHVRLIAPKTGQLLREHLHAPRGWHRIHDDDRPARTPQPTLALLSRAVTAGPHIGSVCRHIQAHGGAHGVRQILGVLALAKKHGAAVVDDAAKAAIDMGVLTYRFVRKYVERRPPVPLTLRQVDPLIRQLTLYRDLIDRKTGDPT